MSIHLLVLTFTSTTQVRFGLEVLVLIGSVWYIFIAMKEIYHQGFRVFFITLVRSILWSTHSPWQTKSVLQYINILNTLYLQSNFPLKKKDTLCTLYEYSIHPSWLLSLVFYRKVPRRRPCSSWRTFWSFWCYPAELSVNTSMKTS